MKNTNLESSIKVLFTLFVMIEQDFESLEYYLLNIEKKSINEVKATSKEEKFVIDTTIIDALRFQIILRSCSFLDEWDRFLGNKNEKEYKDRLRLIKKTVKPARSAIKKWWKDLKKVRNEFIAHNFRDRAHNVTIDRLASYDFPDTPEELYFLICYISRMIEVLNKAFPINPDIFKDINNTKKEFSKRNHQNKYNELNETLIEVDSEISKRVIDIYRYDLSMMNRGNNDLNL